MNESGELIAEYPVRRGDGLDVHRLIYGIPCFNQRFFRRTVLDPVGSPAPESSSAAERHSLPRLAL
jgi:hypothetical protein